MGRRLQPRIVIATIAVTLGFALSTASEPAKLPEGQPLAVEATALVPLDTESSLAVVGIQGQVSIESHDQRELRVISRTPGNDGADLPVGIWQVGQKLVIAPAPGEKRQERYLHVEVPANFKVSVDATDSQIVVVATGGNLELRGANLSATIQESHGPIDGDLVGGKLSIADSSDTTLKLQGTTLTVTENKGSVHVRATGGTISLTKVEGPIDVQADEANLLIDSPESSVRVKARKGSAMVAGLQAGAELDMSGTPLVLKEGHGDVTVTSDATVEFHSMAASLHVELNGGSLRGKGNQGTLDVRTRNGEVNVEAIEQALRVQGDGLKATIADVGGELSIDTTISDVTIDRVTSVVAKIDRGSLTLQRAGGAVQANVVGGDVHIIDGNGPVTLDLEGGDADVSWASFSGDKDTHLTNRSGSITVRVPVSGPARLVAKSRYGRIDGSVPGVRVSDDLNEAQGPINGGSRPVVHVDASGDIHLAYGSEAHDAN